MTLRTIVDLAINAELKQLSVKTDISTVIGYVNLGLIEVYKRIPLKVEEYIIQIQDGVSIYTMPSDFMWIVAAYGEVDKYSGKAVNILPINREDDVRSVNTVGWNKVQVPDTETGAYISIIYRASPTLLTEADLDNEVDLPVQLIEALLHYIGYRGHAAINGEISAENSTHYTRFEKSISTVISEGMYNSDDTDMVNRIGDRGFI